MRIWSTAVCGTVYDRPGKGRDKLPIPYIHDTLHIYSDVVVVVVVLEGLEVKVSKEAE